MAKINIDLEKFISLLKQLDSEIDKNFNNDFKLEIKAIGGFAMIYHENEHNIKGREISSDIDNLSIMSEDINKIIKEIGRNNFVEEDWLNNDWIIAKRGNEEFEYFADWKLIKDYNFKHILLYILDIETLFFFKMKAIDEKINIAKEEPRQQDIRFLSVTRRIG